MEAKQYEWTPEDDAYFEGVDAAKAGQGIGKNPYRHHTYGVLDHAWENGWRAGDRDKQATT